MQRTEHAASLRSLNASRLYNRRVTRSFAAETSPDLIDAPRLLVIPLGSTEQHGPHLPVGTDTVIAEAWAAAFAATIDEPSLVAPVLPFGAAGEHQHFAGTLSIGTEALVGILVELARSASDRFDRLVVLSGHGGNHDALRTAADQLRAEGHTIDVVMPVLHGGDAHAGRSETSLMLHITPDLVHLDRAEPGNTGPMSELLPRIRKGGMAAVSHNGVLGDPAGASAVEGERLLSALVDHARQITGL